MLFVTYEFAFFLPIVIIIYFLLPVTKRWIWLLLISYVFYGYYNPAYILLILTSTSIDFLAGIKIYRAPSKALKRKWLLISIVSNLGLLFYFKYFNFFTTEVMWLLESLNLEHELPKHNFLLPLGISFYTFQTISYSVDIYRGYLKPERHFGRFALFVCFFPQLVAGPIERAKRLIRQFHFNYQFDYQRVVEGLQLLLWGVFKKLVVADTLGIYVNEIFDLSNNHHGISVIIGAFFFALQVFYDFSAYTDMAIGMARIMGIQLSRNFVNHVYQPSPIEFWKVWHITLTTWFRDYVFFPLTRIKHERWFLFLCLFFTFVITGLWHGASWTFIAWGTIHGIALCADHFTRDTRRNFFKYSRLSNHPKIMYAGGIIVMFFIHVIASIFFRSRSIQASVEMLSRACDWSTIYLNPGLKISQLCIILFIAIFADILNINMGNKPLIQYLKTKSGLFRWAFYIILIYSIFLFRSPVSSTFIYFDF